MNRLKLLGQKNVLVVIDMQEGFTSAKNPLTIQECLRLIDLFKREKYPIIALHYANDSRFSFDYGKLLAEISMALQDYSKKVILEKNFDDGSNEIDQHLSRQYAWPAKEVTAVLCGVNADACVKDTAHGLVQKEYKVIVVKKACNGSYQAHNWSDYKIKQNQLDLV